jgi:hypothetical protein
MQTWRAAILETIESVGGQASLQEIYVQIPNFKPLTKKDLTKWGHQPMYHHYIRSIIRRLCKRGELLHISRGFYSLRG